MDTPRNKILRQVFADTHPTGEVDWAAIPLKLLEATKKEEVTVIEGQRNNRAALEWLHGVLIELRTQKPEIPPEHIQVIVREEFCLICLYGLT